MSESRRQFSVEFKREAVQLIVQQGLSVAEAARRLDVRESLLRRWRKALEATKSAGQPMVSQPSALEVEVRQLREEVRRLTIEREILKKATMFFAKESK